jgi:Lysozyme like domain
VADYSIAQLAQAAQAAGFSGANLVTAVAVSLAEDTSRSLRAVGVNTDGTKDRGPWQFNSKWHPEVSDSCAFDLNCAAREAFRVSNQGRSWTPWATYTSGRYKQYLSDAAANSSASDASPDSVGLPGIPDLSGIATAMQAGAAQIMATSQVALGGFLLLAGVFVAVVIVVVKNA